jgi:NTP pyrophosphatase (non-canonical NTP hydrolase)
MQLAELTEVMHRFVDAKGWYGPDSSKPQTSRNLAISLCLEAGEVLEHFQWSEAAPDRQVLADELADVQLYLLQLSSLNGVDLEQAVLHKLDVNYGRDW